MVGVHLLHVHELQKGKNLLAFSAGVDSSALFYLLLERSIDFDLAFVNYHTRKQSDTEEAHARELAKEYDKKIFICHADRIDRNFEHHARKVRYEFFERILHKEGYDHLILAHQLNDRLEWFMLSLLKGSGLDSLIGSNALEKRLSQAGYVYSLVRPLWFVPKTNLYAYLKKNQKKYFEDESNRSFQYDRNRIRHQYTDLIIHKHASQIIQSFKILEQERSALYPPCLQRFGDVIIFPYKQSSHQNLHYIAKALKILGYLISCAQREEILRQEYQIVVGGLFGVGVSVSGFIFVSPYLKHYCNHDRSKIKNRMRVLKIPPYNRAYLSYHLEYLKALECFLKSFCQNEL